MLMLGRIQVPASVKRGEPFEVRVIVQHPMETGFRRDLQGQAIPVNIVERMACRYGGAEVFRAELGTGIAANPYVAFYVVARESGPIEVEWSDDRGEHGRASANVDVA
ncbi:MAG TPA: thiosulfate oxidation carrier complex protein SoxZ [Usitatibacter sp.]|jgi:sulfur-oxidizing protein SoxZ|nr:thiosulfate oxidation carrier complex protein SoxZ [Usitatibacter sp.]